MLTAAVGLSPLAPARFRNCSSWNRQRKCRRKCIAGVVVVVAEVVVVIIIVVVGGVAVMAVAIVLTHCSLVVLNAE